MTSSRASPRRAPTTAMVTALALELGSFSKLLDEAETHLHHHVQSPMEGWILLFLA